MSLTILAEEKSKQGSSFNASPHPEVESSLRRSTTCEESLQTAPRSVPRDEEIIMRKGRLIKKVYNLTEGIADPFLEFVQTWEANL